MRLVDNDQACAFGDGRSTLSRNSPLSSRSGETSSRSMWSLRSRSRIACQSSRFELLIVAAWTPARSVMSIGSA